MGAAEDTKGQDRLGEDGSRRPVKERCGGEGVNFSGGGEGYL